MWFWKAVNGRNKCLRQLGEYKWYLRKIKIATMS